MPRGHQSRNREGEALSEEVHRTTGRQIHDLEPQLLERAGAWQMLCDVASMANHAQNVEEAAVYCLRRVGEYHGWSFGIAYLPPAEDPNRLIPTYLWYAADGERFRPFVDVTFDTPLQRGQGQPGAVFASRQPQWSTDLRGTLDRRRAELAQTLKLVTAAAFPVMAEERAVGVLEFFSPKRIEPRAEVFDSMASVGTQLGRVIERKMFQDRLLTLSEDEHRRIGQELHDDVGQELTGLALKAETLAEMLDGQAKPAAKLARDIVVTVDRIRGKTRALSRGLVPTEVHSPGLATALEELAHRMGEETRVSCTFHQRGSIRIRDSRIATQLYRIAQEAAANSIACAPDTRVDILLQSDEDATLLEIRDGGPGMPPGAGEGDGMGLQIMRYRAGLIGASFAVESPSTGGVRVTCRLPNPTLEDPMK